MIPENYFHKVCFKQQIPKPFNVEREDIISIFLDIKEQSSGFFFLNKPAQNPIF